jgi:hypothetical protein
MAIYHLTAKPVSRAGGRSATAASAYRSAELVHDHTTGETFDYTRKRGMEHAEIVLPTECAKRDINWARDREVLWNAAERAENRSNSRVAREYELALPHEMTREQRVELVRAFSQGLADRYGVAVDFAIHAPHREGDERNHHAHLLTTTRSIEADGLGAKTEVEWSETNRKRAGLVPGPDELTAVRAQWAQLTNERLAELGIEARIDHRTLEAQGIERVPTTHLGVAVWGMERRGIETEVGQRVREQQRLEAQARLERAAELGRVEREQGQVQRSILDLSGDLQAAKKERGLDPHNAAQAAVEEWQKRFAHQPRASVEEERREGVEAWLKLRREREQAQAKESERTPGIERSAMSLEDIRRQGREDWLALRAELAAEQAPSLSPAQPYDGPRRERAPEAGAGEREGAAPELDLTQIKSEGREALKGLKQELQREQAAERARELELERKRVLEQEKQRALERSRGRGLGRGRGRDGPEFER